jgi:predicted RNA binding protein YcfA (HicA-like mRNA interferase family)
MWCRSASHRLVTLISTRPNRYVYNGGVGADKTLQRILSGTADAAIRFDDLCRLLERLGFECRVRGSHHLFRKDGVPEMINVQRDGQHAKAYQVRQARGVIVRAKLGGS